MVEEKGILIQPMAPDAMLCSVKQPDDGRYVIVQDVRNENVLTAGCRFINGECFGEELGERITLSDRAIWFESRYFTSACVAK